LYIFLYGLWYTDLMMACKMGRNYSPLQETVLRMTEFLWTYLLIWAQRGCFTESWGSLSF